MFPLPGVGRDAGRGAVRRPLLRSRDRQPRGVTVPAWRFKSRGGRSAPGAPGARGWAAAGALTAVLIGALGAGCTSVPRSGSAGEALSHQPAAPRYGIDLPLSAAPRPGESVQVPDSVTARADRWTSYSLGLQEELGGRFGEALDHYRRAGSGVSGNPDLLVRQAVCLRELRRPEEALAVARRALARDSTHTEALWITATSQVALGRFEGALQTLSRLVELGPEARAHRLMAGVYERLGRPADALEQVNHLVRLNPTMPQLLEQRAELLMKLGRVDEALADYWTILETSPQYPGITESLTSALERLGRTEELIRLYRTLRERHPRQLRAQWRLIELLLAGNRWDEAEAELEQLRSLRPADGLPVLQLGLVAYRRGDAGRALDLLNQARLLGTDPALVWRWEMRIQFAEGNCPAALVPAESLTTRSPAEPEGWRIRSLCLAEAGQVDEALRAIDAWGKTEPDSAEPYMLGAAICREHGRVDQTLQLLKLAARRDPDNNGIKLEYAAYLESIDRAPEAEELIQGILRDEPESAEALNFLGYMWVERGLRLDEAETLIGRALEIDPENPAYLDSMGWLWYKRGDLGKAQQWLEQAVQRGGRHPEIFTHLAQVRVEQGNVPEARQALEAGLRWSPGDTGLLEFLQSLEGER